MKNFFLIIIFFAVNFTLHADIKKDICKVGDPTPGTYIIKYSNRNHHNALSPQRKESIKNSIRDSLGLVKKSDLSNINENYEVVYMSNYFSEGIPQKLQEALDSGELESVIQDRVSVCPLNNKVKGTVRPVGSLSAPNPKTLVVGAFGKAFSIPLNGKSPTITNLHYDYGNNTGELFAPRGLKAWDVNQDGFVDFTGRSQGAVWYQGQNPITKNKLVNIANDGSGNFGVFDSQLFNGIEGFERIETGLLDDSLQTKLLQYEQNRLYEITQGGRILVFQTPYPILALKDLNNDGFIDILSAHRYLQNERMIQFYTHYGNGNRGFSLNRITNPEADYFGGQDVTTQLVDLDDDGDLDIVNDLRWDISLQSNIHRSRIGMYINDGSFQSTYGGFIDIQGSTGYIPLDKVIFNDLDNDGQPELIFNVDDQCSSSAVVVFKNDNGDLVNPQVLSEGNCISELNIEDIDGDGDKDILIGAENELHIGELSVQSGSLVFQEINFGDTGAQEVLSIDAVDANALIDVVVELKSSSGTFYSITDKNGEFDFSEIPSGRYSIKGYHNRFEILDGFNGTIDISRDTNVRLEALMTLPPIPNYVRPTGSTNDPGFGYLWGLHNNINQSADINALEAWRTTKGDPNLVVAVLDTGINAEHPDIRNNMWVNPREIPGNARDDDANGYVDDVFGTNLIERSGDPFDAGNHGTHVAGTIAATGDNNIGIVGVAPNVKIMAVKVLGAFGGTHEQILGGLDYVSKMKDAGVNIRVVNMSLGAAGACPQPYIDAFNVLNSKGISVVIAAGNGGNDGIGDNNDVISYTPANCLSPNVISVANVTNRGVLASSSNYGVGKVHIGAPGSSILSVTPNGQFDVLNGTSMATPHVSGVLALMYSVNPRLTPPQTKDLLLRSYTPLGDLNGKIKAPGIIDAVQALNNAKNPEIALPPNTNTKIKKIRITPRKLKVRGGKVKIIVDIEHPRENQVRVIFTSNKNKKRRVITLKPAQTNGNITTYKRKLRLKRTKRSKKKGVEKYKTEIDHLGISRKRGPKIKLSKR